MQAERAGLVRISVQTRGRKKSGPAKNGTAGNCAGRCNDRRGAMTQLVMSKVVLAARAG